MLSLASFWFACAHLFPSFVGKTFCRFFFFPGATESSSLGLGRLGLTAHGPSLPSSVLFRHALFIEFSNVVAVCMIARFSFPLLISLCVCKCVNPRLHILRALRLSAGFFFFLIFKIFIYFRLCWVFLAVHGLSRVAASRGLLSSNGFALDFSLRWLLLLRGILLQVQAGSVSVLHLLSCPAAYGIFPDRGWNPCPLNWQAGS